LFFTPRNEIRIDAGWQIETLLSVVVANIVREIELFGPNNLTNDHRFQNAKAISTRIAETYRSFGADAFGIGFNYGKNAGAVTQPILVPAAVLGHHIEDLATLIKSSGYKHGILIQLNNLDIGEIHDEYHIKYLFNAFRDYSQTNGISWLLVGDIGLRKFIAQQVDRLDDIVSFEVSLKPLEINEFEHLILKRVEFYRTSKKVELPIDMDVFLYLFQITKGRLRYIFGLLARLMANLHIGDLTDRVTLDVAKPMLRKLAKIRIERNDISVFEQEILTIIVQKGDCTTSDIAKQVDKSPQYVGKTLNKLYALKLAKVKMLGKTKHYRPSMDAVIAFSKE